GVGDGAISDASRPSPGSVGPCSDLQALLAQDAEDRLDCVTLGPHLVDERADQRFRGSSSPAKKIEARRRISLSSHSRLTSDFKRLISADSSLVTPERVPSSTSAGATQRPPAAGVRPPCRPPAAPAARPGGSSWPSSPPSRPPPARTWGSSCSGMPPI